MPNTASTETINAVHIGYKFKNIPKAIPPKATWDMASPKSDCLLKTRNNPITEHIIATAVPVIKARCIKANLNISNDIIFMFQIFLLLLSVLYFLYHLKMPSLFHLI